MPDGYETKLSDGKPFGEALLEPSAIYVALVAELLAKDVEIRYISHIIGHGYRKFMRANADFTYRITDVGEVPEVLACLQKRCALTDEEAFGRFNMGTGLAFYVPENSGKSVLQAAAKVG